MDLSLPDGGFTQLSIRGVGGNPIASDDRAERFAGLNSLQEAFEGGPVAAVAVADQPAEDGADSLVLTLGRCCRYLVNANTLVFENVKMVTGDYPPSLQPWVGTRFQTPPERLGGITLYIETSPAG